MRTQFIVTIAASKTRLHQIFFLCVTLRFLLPLIQPYLYFLPDLPVNDCGNINSNWVVRVFLYRETTRICFVAQNSIDGSMPPFVRLAGISHLHSIDLDTPRSDIINLV